MEIANPSFEDGRKDDGRVQYKKRPVRAEVNQTSMIHKTDNKKSSITAVFILIVFTVQILIMAAALSLAVYSHMKIQTYNGPIDFLTTQTDLILWQMKQMDSQLQAKIELVRDSPNYSLEVFRTSITRELNTLNTTTMGQLSDLQSSVNTLNTTTMGQLSDLQSSVNTLNITTMGLLSDLQDNILLHALDNLTALRVKFDQLSSFDTSVASQLISMQNLIQTITSAQNNLRQNLQSVDLYRGCTQNTRTCTMSTGGSIGYYWRSCATSYININATVSYSLAL